MCRAVTCKTCGKTAWAGCGRHVDQVMAGVPAHRQCPGHHDTNAPAAGGESGGGNILRRLLGRGRS